MTAPSYGQYWPITARRWDAAKTTRKNQAHGEAAKLYANKNRYVGLVQRFAAVHPGSEVPWWWVACAHMRESGARFDRQLAQGDPLDQVSTHVPRGEGPYYGPDAWERSGVVAMEAKKLQDIRDWRLEKALFWWEAFNGWGYWNKGRPSAYIWSGLSIYDPPTGPGGKYVGDGDWDGSETDEQMGCAAILHELMSIDSTVNPERETPPGVADKPTPAPPPPAPPDQAKLPETKPMLDQQTIATMIIGLVGLYPPAAPFVPLIQKAVPIGFKIWNDLHDDTKNQITPLLFQAINQFITERNKQA